VTHPAPAYPDPRLEDAERRPVPLSSLPRGAVAVVCDRLMPCEECELLCAMGLSCRCPLRVCRAGEPCIIQVASTRLGLSAEVAGRILVRPITQAP
jgi:Fe2+ transport system protein FeoA